MTFCKQLVSFYLALSVALAGAVGLSPALHRLIEHGGLGPAHSHAFPAHERFQPAAQSSFADLLVHHQRAFALPAIPFGKIWHNLAHFLTDASQPEPPSKNSRGHEHHSLAQMMASGFAEQALDAVFFECRRFPIGFQPFPPEIVPAHTRFELQGAGRGPPSLSS